MGSLVRVWPKTYKVLLVLTVLLLIAAAALYVFFLMPLYEEHESSKDSLESERSKVTKSEWDASETGIATATKMYTRAIGTKRSPAAQEKSEALLVRSTEHLQKLIDAVKEASKNPSITKDGKKTYSDKYDEIKKRLSERRIELIPAVYGMGRTSEGNYYNMTLKLLMTQEIVELLLKHKLRILTTDSVYTPETDQIFTDIRELEAQKKVRASELTVKPIVSYSLKSGEEPYLLEVSLTAKIIGSLADFSAFAKDLSSGGRCYSLTRMEMQTMKPVMRNTRQALLIASQENAKGVRIEAVTVTFTCTGFAKPEIDKMEEELRKLNRKRERERGPVISSEKPIGI